MVKQSQRGSRTTWTSSWTVCSSTCGDGWATWGVLPPNAEEYGLDEDSTAPYRADGFERRDLGAISDVQICRFDSTAARGYSRAVLFTRREPERDEDDIPRAPGPDATALPVSYEYSYT